MATYPGDFDSDGFDPGGFDTTGSRGDGRVIVVSAESRIVAVPSQSRVVTIDADPIEETT